MKICFVALSLYPCLADDYKDGRIGGAEVQQVQIARGLVRRGIDVSAVTENHGQSDGVRVSGVTVYRTYIPGSGIPLLRFLYPKLTSIYGALRRADADVYYVRNASFLTSVVENYCRRYGKHWCYAGAHDTDFIPGKELITSARDRWLYRQGLKKAEKILVQSNVQAELLDNNYRRKSSLFRNFSDQDPKTIDESERKYILWVSTIRWWKRPELFLELAATLPDFLFIMVGGADGLDPELYRQIEQSAEKLSNLSFLGFKSLQDVESLFDQARIFVNTSVNEGFPNTFLQSWRRGIPVISYFDPDNVIQVNKLGRRVESIPEATAAAKALWKKDPDAADRIRSYFSQNHSNSIIDSYLKLFKAMK